VPPAKLVDWMVAFQFYGVMGYFTLDRRLKPPSWARLG
jgi:hypothetical protein